MSTSIWKIDSAHSQVDFSVKHMMFTTVRGRFSAFEGHIDMGAEGLENPSVEVSVDVASLDTRVPDRDAHLRSGDFFDVESHPTMTFLGKRAEGSWSNPGDSFQVVGDLTIRGITREVVLDARFEGTGTDPWGGTRAGFSAETTVDRRDFGLTWNQALEAGGVLVGHEVRIELQIQAVQVREAAFATSSA